jgi:hypothetical protein
MVYTDARWNHMVAANLDMACVYIYIYYMVYICYIVVVYIVHKWYIPVICSPHQYGWYLPSKTLMGLFHLFFYNDIPCISHVCQKDIYGISKVYHWKKGMEQTQKCFTLRTYRPYWWRLHMSVIYHVYTMYIPCIYQSSCDIPVIYQEYSLCRPHAIHHANTYYIDMIYNTHTEFIHHYHASLFNSSIKQVNCVSEFIHSLYRVYT